MNKSVLETNEKLGEQEEELQIFKGIVVNMNERLLKEKRQFYSIGKMTLEGKKIETGQCKILPESADSKPFNGADGLATGTNKEKYRNIKNSFRGKLKASWNDKFC